LIAKKSGWIVGKTETVQKRSNAVVGSDDQVPGYGTRDLHMQTTVQNPFVCSRRNTEFTGLEFAQSRDQKQMSQVRCVTHVSGLDLEKYGAPKGTILELIWPISWQP
jgi:hypothetical protein